MVRMNLSIFSWRLKNVYNARDESIHNFVGFEFTEDGGLHQGRKVRKLIEEYLGDCNAISTPIEINQPLMDVKKERKYSEKQISRLLGALQYSCHSRPDIRYAVHKLSKEKQNDNIYRTLLRILKYLKNEFVIETKKRVQMGFIECYVDASFAPDEDRKSISGWVILLKGTPILWKTKKQTLVAQSSAEAEFIALAEALKDVLYVKNLVEAWGLNSKEAINMHVDNKAAIEMGITGNHKRTRHIDIKFKFVTHHVKEGTINLKYVESAENIADMLTKPLGRERHEKHISKLGLYNRCRVNR